MFKFLSLDKTTYDNYIPPNVEGYVVDGELLTKLNQYYPFYNLTITYGIVADITDDTTARAEHEAYLAQLASETIDADAELANAITASTTLAQLKAALLGSNGIAKVKAEKK